MKKGIIKPLHCNVFKAAEIQQAFRHFSSRYHIGKVLIELCEDVKSNCSIPILLKTRQYYEPQLVYIVCDNFDEFGLEFVDWMVIRGARNLILNSFSSLSKAIQLYRIS